MADFAQYPPPFLVDERLVQPDLNRITGPLGPVQVEPRVMQVLLVLVRQPQVVVPRDRLLDEVWADRIVGEENLTRAISELRRIFSDDSRQPRVIETIRNHGYRLIAEVHPAPAPTPTSALASPTPPPPQTEFSPNQPSGADVPPPASRVRPWGWLLLAGLLLAGGFYWALNQGSTPRKTTPAPWTGPPLPLTSYPGRERHPALSSTGTRVAFVWAGPDLPAGCANALYVKQRNSETPLRLTGAPGWVAWPAWSPDDQTLAFVQGGRQEIRLCVIAALGGAVRSLYHSEDLIEGVDWLTDRKALVFAARDSAAGARKLMVLDLASLTVRALPASLAQSGEDIMPHAHPAGERLAWIHRDPGGEYSLCEGSLNQTEVRRPVEGVGVIAGVSWLPRGDGLVYSAAADGLFKLWTFLPGRDLPLLLDTGQGSALNPTVSGRSGDLAFELVRMDRNLILIRVVGRDPWQLESGFLAPSTRGEYSADFSPEGDRIALVSDRSGYPEVWLTDSSGANLDQLTTLKPESLGHLRWSPRGDKLAFEVRRDGHLAIMVLDAAGGRPQQVALTEGEDALSGWIPTGQALLVARHGAGGWQMLSVGLPGAQSGSTEVVVSIAATSGELDEAGNALYFTRPDREGLWRQNLNSGQLEIIVPDLLPSDRGNWRLSGDHIAWVERIAGVPYLRWLDLETGVSSMVADLPGLADGGLSVAPDGRAFLYAQGTVVAADLMFMPKNTKKP